MNLLESTHEALKQKLARGVVQFAFKKLDGSLRTAVGTTNLSNVPVDHHPKGVREASSKVTVYFDIEKKEWRSVSKRVEDYLFFDEENKVYFIDDLVGKEVELEGIETFKVEE